MTSPPAGPRAGRSTRRIVAASVVVAGALLIGAQRRRSRAPHAAPTGPGGRPPGLATVGRAARNVEVARLGSAAAGNYAVTRARQVFASAERRDELAREFELRTAEQVAASFGNMKGALMKLGQMVSYLDQGLPEHVRTALSQLQSDSPPMSPELASKMIEDELGAPPAALFAEFDEVPIAAASIGQVHRAITHDGRAVAVKVQYPGVADAVESDLANVGLLFRGMGTVFDGFDHRPFVEELTARLSEELDYRLEAEHQTLFAEHYRDHPTIHVPDVVPELSTARVLTTDLAEGMRFDELLLQSQEERDLAAETLYRFAFGSLYRLHLFNGDPHPGNYLFRPGGHVTFLDFGLVKRFTAEEIGEFEDMILAMVVRPDPAEFRRIIERIGLLRPDEAFSDEEIADYFGHFYEFVQEEGPTVITPEYASETIRRFFDVTGPYGAIMKAANLPPSFVIINRINLGLYSLFGELHARAEWRRLAEEIWPFVGGPPATPMGQEIAQWEARRRAGSGAVGERALIGDGR